MQWSRRIELDGWQEEVYLSALGIGKMLERIYYENEPGGKEVQRATWQAMVDAGVVEERTNAYYFNNTRVHITLVDIVSAYEYAHWTLPYRQEAPYYLAKFSRLRVGDYKACVSFAVAALAGGAYNESTLFAETHVYKYAVLDELCTSAYYVPNKAQRGQQACENLIAVLEIEGAREVEETSWAAEMLRRVEKNHKWYVGEWEKREEVTLNVKFGPSGSAD